MRINKFLARATGLSRRAADTAIQDKRVGINSRVASLGDSVDDSDSITLDNQPISLAAQTVTIRLNKPAGYVCSRNGQGSQTIYDLLPAEYSHLKPIGRLDKDSSGLLLLTNDGDLANQLTHPRYAKTKIYDIELNKSLEPLHQQIITNHGLMLDDGLSRLILQKRVDSDRAWQVTMQEGRNRQIRRTFGALGYRVTKLHRNQFGSYRLGELPSASYEKLY